MTRPPQPPRPPAPQRVLPPITYPPDLPVSARREDILAALQASQVVIIAGETGSGKTTQLPKMLLEAGVLRRGVIGHTQPRRIAARAVAARLEAELPGAPPRFVGHKIRFSDGTSRDTAIKVMTDGILLADGATTHSRCYFFLLCGLCTNKLSSHGTQTHSINSRP